MFVITTSIGEMLVSWVLCVAVLWHPACVRTCRRLLKGVQTIASRWKVDFLTYSLLDGMYCLGFSNMILLFLLVVDMVIIWQSLFCVVTVAEPLTSFKASLRSLMQIITLVYPGILQINRIVWCLRLIVQMYPSNNLYNWILVYACHQMTIINL